MIQQIEHAAENRVEEIDNDIEHGMKQIAHFLNNKQNEENETNLLISEIIKLNVDENR